MCEEIEGDIRRALPESTIFTHLEPREDPASFADKHLDRHPDAESTFHGDGNEQEAKTPG